MYARRGLVSFLGLLLIVISSFDQSGSDIHRPENFRNLGETVAAAGVDRVYLPLTVSSGYVPRVNAPHFPVADIFPDYYDEMTIFWLGRVTPAENYADIRIGYTDTALELRLAIFDRLLWYDTSPSPGDLHAWDAVTLYFDLDGEGVNAPDESAYRFVSQLGFSGQDRGGRQAAYQGNGTGWSPLAAPFTTTGAWRGDGVNDSSDDRGWEAGFKIPFASLGLTGPPAQGTLWRFGVAVQDRDDGAGAPLPDQLWPERLNPLRAATWGELHFGLPSYTPPAATATETVVIREGVAGADVPDVAVGGTVENLCPGNAYHIWNEWGNQNYGTSKALNIQNQRDVADWPCFAKYFVKFPLDAIPGGKTIISATLTLDHWGNSGVPDPGQPNTAGPSFVHVLTVPPDWTENTLTWNNDPEPMENVSQAWVPVVAQCLPGSGPECLPRNWDLSYAVSKAYAAGGAISFALYSSDGAYHSGKFFAASNTAEWAAPTRPALTVVWGEPMESGDSANEVVSPSGFAGKLEGPGHEVYLPLILPGSANWSMAGANPQRTSWSPETLPGEISTVWVKPIAPYVPQHVQVVGAEGKVFVSTAAGLYAFDADTGADAWQYPTELPLGHSPTYDRGYLYVGGMDRKLHKISAQSGQGVWTFTAEGGFSTNPVVANGRVYAGSRDGAFYAVNANDGTLAWKFQTGNQILQSAAYQPENDGIAATTQGTLFFASNDGYAYALDAKTGTQVWQSDSDPTTAQRDKFPSMGFYSWWPVIYGDYVILTRTSFYSTNGAEAFWLFCPPGSTFDTCTSIPNGVTPGILGNETQPGYWPVGEPIVDVSSNPYGSTFPDYFEAHPYRRNAFFIDRTTGVEQQFDLDSDGIPDYAPISWVGDSGTHDPPVVVGNATAAPDDDVLYFHTANRSRSLSFSNANVSGWKVGTPFLSLSTSYVRSSDEPTGISAAGNKIYYNHCCDRGVGAFDVSRPNATFPSTDPTREWRYMSSGGLPFYSWPSDTYGLPAKPNAYYFEEAAKFFWDPQTLPNAPTLPCCAAVFWNENDKVGPAAYQGKLYVILGNALVAFGKGGAGANAPVLPSAPFVAPPDNVPSVTAAQLNALLEQEVAEIIAAGHLKPSYSTSIGHWSRAFEDSLTHYWHNPADLQLVLLRALPHLSPALQNQVRAYLQTEFALYSPALYSHVGFASGVQRDPYPYPPAENVFRLFTIPDLGSQTGSLFAAWSLPPQNVYALWKYAQAGLEDAQTLLDQLGNRFKAPITANRNSADATVLTDAYLKAFPNVHNAYIAGYIGYVELAQMAGRPQAEYAAYETELARLKALRVQNLMAFPNPQEPWMCENECYYESLITYYNFAYMTPELADYLAANAVSPDPSKDILAILQKYQEIAPYWMVAHNGATQGEFTIMPYQQTHSLFQALAMVKKAPRAELIDYLDTPIVPVGDLYYIDNLVAALEAP